jgi:DNA-binding CsgD family transcriptional regulator
MLEAARPALDHGLGVGAWLVDASDPARVRAWSFVLIDTPPGTTELLEAASGRGPGGDAGRAPPEMERRYWTAAPAHTQTQAQGLRELPEGYMRSESAKIGARDGMAVVACDPTGLGVTLQAPLPDARWLGRREQEEWSRTAAHMAAAFRIRRALRPGGGAIDAGAEAIMAPGGKLEHAEGSARSRASRDALKEAARAVDEARRRRPADPAEALALWRALVAGRWSIVERFDTDGRRYLVARPNDPAAAGPELLTERERQVLAFAAMGHSNKLVSYELGLDESTVSEHLRAAARKLGFRSRVALVRAAASASAPGPSGAHRP